MGGGNSFLSTQQETQKPRVREGTFQSKQYSFVPLPLSPVTSGSRTGAYSSRKKSSGAKRLWAYSGFSGDYCCERVCVGLCELFACVCVRERERDREKVGQGKRGGQPQLSASVNVLTVHLHISMCHESPNMYVCLRVCMFACVKGAGGVERLRPWALHLIGNPLSSRPQGHFLLFVHLPGNPPVTLWPSMSASRQIRGFPWKQQALLSFLPLVLTPAMFLLIQTLYPSQPGPEAITHSHTHAQTSDGKHYRKM